MNRKMGIGISLTGPGVGLKISFKDAITHQPLATAKEILLPASVQAYGDTMQLTLFWHSHTNFGIYVNGQWQANSTEISQDFVPYTYNIILPETKDNVEFLNVEQR